MAEERRVSVWRHPRRLGFILFNLVALKLVVNWLTFRLDAAKPGDAGTILDTVLGAAGIAVVIIVWIGMWVAWGVFVYLRHRRHSS